MPTRRPPPPEKRLPISDLEIRNRGKKPSGLSPEWDDRLTAALAMQGDFGFLIDSLAGGLEIGHLSRAFLIGYITGEIPRHRGNIRTYAAMQTNTAACLRVVFMMVERQVPKTTAMKILADETAGSNSPINLETLRTTFRRFEKACPEYLPFKKDGVFVLPW